MFSLTCISSFKVCVASPRGFQDVASLVAVADTFATTEPFLDGKYDIRIQKIGRHYKVYKYMSTPILCFFFGLIFACSQFL